MDSTQPQTHKDGSPQDSTQSKDGNPSALNNTNTFQTFDQLFYNSRYDKRLTPGILALYIALWHECNKNFWRQPFKISDSELMDKCNIKSKSLLLSWKNRLKDLNYIYFKAKERPTSYIIYPPPDSPRVQQQVQQQVQNLPLPSTPPNPIFKDSVIKTANTSKQTIKKEKKKEKKEGTADVHPDERNSQPVEPSITSETFLEQLSLNRQINSQWDL